MDNILGGNEDGKGGKLLTPNEELLLLNICVDELLYDLEDWSVFMTIII